jgi:hypothetical protein
MAIRVHDASHWDRKVASEYFSIFDTASSQTWWLVPVCCLTLYWCVNARAFTETRTIQEAIFWLAVVTAAVLRAAGVLGIRLSDFRGKCGRALSRRVASAGRNSLRYCLVMLEIFEHCSQVVGAERHLLVAVCSVGLDGGPDPLEAFFLEHRPRQIKRLHDRRGVCSVGVYGIHGVWSSAMQWL